MKDSFLAAVAAAFVLLASAGMAAAAVTPLSVSCAGTAGTSSVAWAATTLGGVAPYSLLWGNGGTTSPMTLSYSPGTYAMTIQATDASTSVATSSCSATVVAPLPPSITSFTATPSSILAGSSTVLAWTVSNASSTSLDNGIGAVSSTSMTVSPAVTTTYTLTATNPNGSVSATATVTVGTTTPGGSTLQQQIQALLQQIAALQQQLAQLIASHLGGGVGSSTPPFIPPGQIGKLACIELGRNLHVGDKGDDVMKLQQMLASDPSTGFSASTTGFFGPLTARAIMRFQIQQGIVSSEHETDGSVGPLTMGFFNRSCGKGLIKHGDPWTNPATTSSDGMTSSTSGATASPWGTQGNENSNEHGNGNSNGGNHGNPHDY